ncbi:MAG: hypothetical protein ABIA67_03280 [Candidatus Margulisiibacteriota bacterium]
MPEVIRTLKQIKEENEKGKHRIQIRAQEDKEGKEVVEGLKELKEWLLTHFDKIYGKFEKLENENKLINGGLRRVETDLSTVKTDLNAVKQKVDKIDKTLDEHVRLPAHAGR